MVEFFQYVIGGLAVGSIYGLVALGFVLIFKATDVFNFAQGDLLMVGGYLLFTCLATFSLPMIPAILVALAMAAVMGVLLQVIVFRPMIGRPLLTVVMVTIALSLIIRSVMQIFYGPQERSLPARLPSESFGFLGLRISTLDLIVMTKVLPKIHGSRQRLEQTLQVVQLWANGAVDQDDLPPLRPRTYAKLSRMLAVLKDAQFVTFTE